jgi:hypothetical protein
MREVLLYSRTVSLHENGNTKDGNQGGMWKNLSQSWKISPKGFVRSALVTDEVLLNRP